ncbi:hypothetical protein DFH06DRAFT_1346381 [Mycena polygramma]|nr:hypothetical protein DFH06DRAFT_1346381 [Mycena polygramma]
MPDSAFFLQLTSKLSEHSRVLTDSDSPAFKELLLRWSDIDLKVPAAIVQPATEEDVVITVKHAAENNVSFVPKSGGHSLWSSIDGNGFILNLTLLKKISVDHKTNLITLQSGVLTKEANDVAFENGLCLPLGSANPAGVISMALGGGLSALSSICGHTCDNIISARVITAEGTLLTVNESSHPELFWGLRGAGQLLGLVTEITLQGHPLSVLGTDDGTLWTGAMVYPASRVKEVVAALAPLVEDTSAPTAGLFLFTSLPPTLETVIMVLPFYLGPATRAQEFYKPMLDLEPMSVQLQNVPCNRQNDGVDPFCGKGGFKRFAGAGAASFKPEVWPRVLDYFEELKAKCPDAAATAYAFEWSSYLPTPRLDEKDTAFCHKDVKVWAEALSWYTEAASHEDVFRIEQEMIAYFRSHYPGEQPVTYQNWSRDVPVGQLYPDVGKLARLRALKNKWDPKGVFTKLLL